MPMLSTIGAGSARRNGFMGAVSFRFTLPTGQEVNLRAEAIAAGWNTRSAVIATLNGTIYTNNISNAALTVNGTFPQGVTLNITSGGTVLGATGATGTTGYSYDAEALGYGGAGGAGGPPLPNNQGYWTPSSAGSPGSAGNHAYWDWASISYVVSNTPGGSGGTGDRGGVALRISTPTKIINNGHITGGNGGAGGSGGSGRWAGGSGGGGGGSGGGWISGTYHMFAADQRSINYGTTGGVGGTGAGLNGGATAGGYQSGFANGDGGIGVSGGYGGGLRSNGGEGAYGYNESLQLNYSNSAMSPGGAGGVGDSTSLYGGQGSSGASGARGIAVDGASTYATWITSGLISGSITT